MGFEGANGLRDSCGRCSIAGKDPDLATRDEDQRLWGGCRWTGEELDLSPEGWHGRLVWKAHPWNSRPGLEKELIQCSPFFLDTDQGAAWLFFTKFP